MRRTGGDRGRSSDRVSPLIGSGPDCKERSLLIGTSVHLSLSLFVCLCAAKRADKEMQLLEATCTEGNGNMAGLQG